MAIFPYSLRSIKSTMRVWNIKVDIPMMASHALSKARTYAFDSGLDPWRISDGQLPVTWLPLCKMKEMKEINGDGGRMKELWCVSVVCCCALMIQYHAGN